ncbi:AEC family transporter [Kroppenstedtia pulmonis]|uniref:AEC family transporter n=1 Tax=Kroppenstedtia pulmonis TaxID=1380685 RepID=A0A7D3XHG6_9BACL|nr:AEC family transporter [Kroppenstedtia pulmonis]QKG83624.1 AEC family transporter [Kroppenstedtia pulmonis]
MQALIDVMLPVFGIIVVGYIAGRIRLVEKASSKSLNNYVYYVALPALLFISLANAPIEELLNWGFIGSNLAGILISFALCIILARLFFGRKLPQSSIHGMAASYGTTGYMGIPLMIAAFGKGAALPAAIATLIHNIPVIALVILLFESMKNSERKQELLKNISKAIFLNPLTISVLAGICFSIFRIELPVSLDIFSQLLADAAGPTALFALGVGLVGQKNFFSSTSTAKSEVLLTTFIKIFIQPLLTIIFVLYVFDLEGLWATVAIIMSALPVGAGVYVFAQQYDSFKDETSQAIIVSMLISIPTLTGLLIWFS